MYSNQRIYDEVFTPIKHTNGVNRYAIPTSSTLTGTYKTLNFTNIQPTNSKRCAKNFRLTGRINVKFASAAHATDTTPSFYDLVGDLNDFMRTEVQLNGNIRIVSEPSLNKILSNYNNEYNKQDSSFNTEFNYEGIDRTDGTKLVGIGTSHFFNFSTRLSNPALRSPLGGLTNLDVIITFPDDIIALFNTSRTLDALSMDLSDIKLLYTEYDGGSSVFKKLIPTHSYNKKSISIYGALADVKIISTDRITTGQLPVRVYNFISRENDNAFAASVKNVDNSKCLTLHNMKVSINGQSNLLNTSNIQELYSRCKEMGYKGTFSDFSNTKTIFRYVKSDSVPFEVLNNNLLSSVGCVDMKDLPIDVGVNGSFDYVADIDYKMIRVIAEASPEKYSLNTILEHPTLLVLSPEGSQMITATTFEGMSEIADYIMLNDISGEGFGDWIKKGFRWAKDGGISRTIDKANKIASIVAPNSQFTKVLDTAGDVSRIVTGHSTTIY